MKEVVRLANIKMKFQQKTALKDVSFSIAKGEIFGLLGPSGAGKTTLINIVSGQRQPTSGQAWMFEHACSSLTDEDYNRIGMVLDTSGIYPRLSCYDNLLLYVRLHQCSKSRIRKVMEQVGLQKELQTTAGKLSKGMLQRFLLARALLHEPEFLFLDEPTSGLDPLSAKEIHQLLKHLRDVGTTIFLTTHNMQEAAELCDHIALLQDGRIIEYGEPEKLCMKYNTEAKVNIRLTDGTQIVLKNCRENADEIASYFKHEQVEEIHSSSMNLESIFLQLTGKGLNEDVSL